MELSARVEYALLALLEMASRHANQEPLKMSEITAKQAIPDRYLEQILTNLRRSGVVQSQRGAKGGYLLAREPWRITLMEIVASVEGDREPRDHQTPDPSTPEKDLVLEIWQQARAASHGVLSGFTLQDLCQKRDDRSRNDPMYYI